MKKVPYYDSSLNYGTVDSQAGNPFFSTNTSQKKKKGINDRSIKYLMNGSWFSKIYDLVWLKTDSVTGGGQSEGNQIAPDRVEEERLGE